jgi:hypothetical protein
MNSVSVPLPMHFTLIDKSPGCYSIFLHFKHRSSHVYAVGFSNESFSVMHREGNIEIISTSIRPVLYFDLEYL